jgi:hypothetical protein
MFLFFKSSQKNSAIECSVPLDVSARQRWFPAAFIWTVLSAVTVSDKLIAAEISIPNVNAVTGGTVNASIQYRSQGAAIAALQFDLEYNQNVLSVAAAAGSATIGSSKSLETHNLQHGRTRFLVVGANRNLIQDGNLANITIRVTDGAAQGSYTLRIVDAIGADLSPGSVSIGAKSGVIAVKRKR